MLPGWGGWGGTGGGAEPTSWKAERNLDGFAVNASPSCLWGQITLIFFYESVSLLRRFRSGAELIAGAGVGMGRGGALAVGGGTASRSGAGAAPGTVAPAVWFSGFAHRGYEGGLGRRGKGLRAHRPCRLRGRWPYSRAVAAFRAAWPSPCRQLFSGGPAIAQPDVHSWV